MSEPPAICPQGTNIKLVVAYDGGRYHGWQRQADGLATVQGCVEKAVGRLLGVAVAVNGAGRTDAGVHAAGQVANFVAPTLAVPLGKLARAIDSRCPSDVAVVSAREVPADFHASRSAVGKTYRYRIYVGAAKPVMRAGHVYHCRCELDVRRMASAGRLLLGSHDFRGFASSAERRLTTVRTVTRCDVTAWDDEIHVTVSGDGFLYKMVRNLVGTLVEVGRGRWGCERIQKVLTSRNRRDAGPTAPPGGLCLMHVRYPPFQRG